MSRAVRTPSRGLRPSGRSPYRPQLDALRALAITTVLFHHYLDILIGGLGVVLFFVLSGFLITGILLRIRDAADASGQIWFGVRQFYVRRALRIFPLYYFVILLTLVLGLPPTREVLGWLLTFTFNIQVVLQDWFPENLAHFWTLSVEEQFYLFWPWLILFVPRKRLPLAIVGAILVAPLYRALAFASGWSGLAMFILTPSSLDSLGLGSLLAVMARMPGMHGARLGRWMRWFLTAGLGSFVMLGALAYYGLYPRLNSILVTVSVGLACCWLVHGAQVGFGGWLGRVLDSGVLVYCGRISYGIYAYHLMVPGLIAGVLGLMRVSFDVRSVVGFSVSTFVTIGLASLSWHLLEEPINGLKRHFPYGRRSLEAVGMPPASTGGEGKS